MSEISGGNDNDINESSVEETSSSMTEVSGSLDLGTERTSEEINSGSLDRLEGVLRGRRCQSTLMKQQWGLINY